MAEIFEIVNWLTTGTEFLDRLRGGFAGGVVLGCAGEFIEHGEGLGIAEPAKRVDGGQGDSALGMVHVADEEFADGGFLFLVACEVAQRSQGVGVATGGEFGTVIFQRVANLGKVGRVVLLAQRADGGIGELVAERRGAKRLVD